MGLKLAGPLRKRRGRTKVRSPVTWECSVCHKGRGLRHTCVQGTDFKARQREAERHRKRTAAAAKRKAATAERRRKRKAAAAKRAARRKQAAADRRARDRARKQAAKKRPGKPRPRGDSHEPGTCGDRDCPRYGCKAYFAGMADCPGPHEGV